MIDFIWNGRQLNVSPRPTSGRNPPPAGSGRIDSLTLVATGGKVAASVSERIGGLGRLDSLTLVVRSGKVAASVSERIGGLGQDRLAHARRDGRESSRERERADRRARAGSTRSRSSRRKPQHRAFHDSPWRLRRSSKAARSAGSHADAAEHGLSAAPRTRGSPTMPPPGT
jgi:hypothetical protein